ncbi:hypothetical protein ACFYW6_35450 [Streptomyces sp. NPDC002659]|uniref:hypothetical protein n=1 Tax=Streptomyces sp. NPDC002659 TaxID=3364656 RepID=UPI0036BE48CB
MKGLTGYATDAEMGWIAKAVSSGERSWDSVKFYRPGKDGWESVKVDEPDGRPTRS